MPKVTIKEKLNTGDKVYFPGSADIHRAAVDCLPGRNDYDHPARQKPDP